MLLTAKVRSRANASVALAKLSRANTTTANPFRRIGLPLCLGSSKKSLGRAGRQRSPALDERSRGGALRRQVAPVAFVHQLVVDGGAPDCGNAAGFDQPRHQAEAEGQVEVAES